MKFYLRVVNPVIAFVVFILCFWAATHSDETFNIFGIVIGGMNTYFFAKGIFTSVSLLILGRILLEILYFSEHTRNQSLKRNELIFSISFGMFTIGSLIGIFLMCDSDQSDKNKFKIENPADLIISDVYRVKESEKLKFTGRITNSMESDWIDIDIIGKLFINGKLSDEKHRTIPQLLSKHHDDFIINFDEFSNSTIPDSVRMDCQLKAIQKKYVKKVIR
jgi:hypothetical protein